MAFYFLCTAYVRTFIFSRIIPEFKNRIFNRRDPRRMFKLFSSNHNSMLFDPFIFSLSDWSIYIPEELRILNFISSERAVRLSSTYASSIRRSRIKRVRTLRINYLLVVRLPTCRPYFPTLRWQPVNNLCYLTTLRICDTIDMITYGAFWLSRVILNRFLALLRRRMNINNIMRVKTVVNCNPPFW